MILLIIGIFLFILYINYKSEKKMRKELHSKIDQLDRLIESMDSKRCIMPCQKKEQWLKVQKEIEEAKSKEE